MSINSLSSLLQGIAPEATNDMVVRKPVQKKTKHRAHTGVKCTLYKAYGGKTENFYFITEQLVFFTFQDAPELSVMAKAVKLMYM